MRFRARAGAPHAIVIGLDCITGLQTARILASRGVPVLGLARDASHFCARTRACRRVVEADTSGPGLVDALEALGRELAERPVLFPCTDAAVRILSQHRERVEKWHHLLLPPPEAVELLMDKVRFLEFAAEVGLPVPRSYLLRSPEDARRAAGRVGFPCVLKPPFKSLTWQRHTRAKAFKVGSAEELLALYERCRGWSEVLLVQEWVEGGESQLSSCNCYFGREGEALASFVARKLRQWPPQTGTSCLGEEVRNDEVLELALSLFASVGYRGLGYLETKRDPRTGRELVIEPNVGRPTGRSAIAEAGGVELLYTMYCDAVGWPLPEARVQRFAGVRWIYWRHDLQSALHYWRRGELAIGEWWRSLRGVKACAVFAWNDPAPFLADLARSVRRALGRLRAPRRSCASAAD